jgi:hypothetical protein
MFKKASKSLYIKCCGISCPLVSYSVNFFSYKDSENTEEDSDDPKPTDKGHVQMEYSSD